MVHWRHLTVIGAACGDGGGMDGDLTLLQMALTYEHQTRGQSFEEWEHHYEQMEALRDRSGWLRLFRWLRERLVIAQYWPGGSLDGGPMDDAPSRSGQVSVHDLSPQQLQAGLAQIERIAAAPRIKVSRNGRPEAA